MLDGLLVGWAFHEYARRKEGEAASARSASAASEARREVDLLKADLERLFMLVEALWMLLKEQHGYTEEDLVRKIQEVDLRDGKLDGRVAREPPKVCPKCNRALIRNQSKCLYCGAEILPGPFER